MPIVTCSQTTKSSQAKLKPDHVSFPVCEMGTGVELQKLLSRASCCGIECLNITSGVTRYAGTLSVVTMCGNKLPT
jgi:hypothetical protein